MAMNLPVIHLKRNWLCLLGAGVAALLAVFLPGGARDTAAPLQKRLPIYGVCTEEKLAALTFDCAWENSDTEILLELLEQNQVKATFFTTGDWCQRYPEDVRAIVQAGHSIGNHSFQHPHVASISPEALEEDTLRCDEIIRELTGETPRIYRAPYGEYSDEMLALLEDTLGKRVIQWDCDSRDWQGREAAEMVESIAAGIRPGSILLFHNDTANTPAALKQLLPRLRGEGYRFVLVEELISWESCPLNHEGRQVLPS